MGRIELLQNYYLIELFQELNDKPDVPKFSSLLGLQFYLISIQNVLWPPFHIPWEIHILPNLWGFVVPSFSQVSSHHSRFSNYFPLPVISLDFWNCNPLSPASFALAHLKDKQGQNSCMRFRNGKQRKQKICAREWFWWWNLWSLLGKGGWSGSKELKKNASITQGLEVWSQRKGVV